jgi:hypothetical protein
MSGEPTDGGKRTGGPAGPDPAPAAGGEGATAADAGRSETARAWRSFCESLRAAGDVVLGANADAPPQVRAEGAEYLLGLVAAGVRQALELGDPLRPRFLRNPDSHSRWGAENADNQYLWARVDPATRYRIVGTRGSVFDFLIEVKEGYMQLGDDRNFATLSADQIETAPDGSFEIGVCAERCAGNWLPLHPDARYLAIRQYFCDWEHEDPARFRIETWGDDAAPPAPLTEARAAATIDSAARWTFESARFWNEWVEALRRDSRPNALGPARRVAGGADAIHYGNERFRLGPDEALIVEVTPPRARYWAFQLCDPWFRSLDYASRQTSLNQHQVRIDADGRCRCVVAHRDPAVPNWLDTAGHPEGILQYRWIWTDDNPRPTGRVVALGALREVLPHDTPIVTAEQRRRTVRMRRSHVARREPAC